MDVSELLASPEEIARLEAVLGRAARVSYAPPNIYPMAAPTFDPAASRERIQPAGELGLYVHVPYCNYSCMFCFYATRLAPPSDQMRRYVQALERELSWVKPGT